MPKTPSKRPDRPGKNGGALLTGNPGNAGGSGRPPKPFKDFLAELRKDPDAQERLKSVAMDSANRNCVAAWKLIAEYDDEKPAKKLEVSESLSTAERHSRIQRVIDRVMGKAS